MFAGLLVVVAIDLLIGVSELAAIVIGFLGRRRRRASMGVGGGSCSCRR